MTSPYTEFDKEISSWRNEIISDEELKKAWLKLGQAQAKVLPFHMLRRFCQSGDAYKLWNRWKSSFINEKPVPGNCIIEGDDFSEQFSVESDKFVKGLGTLFTLIRGTLGSPNDGYIAYGISEPFHPDIVHTAITCDHDIKMLTALYTARKYEIDYLLPQVEKRDEQQATVTVKRI